MNVKIILCKYNKYIYKNLLHQGAYKSNKVGLDWSY